MGLTKFENLGEVADAGLDDGINGRVGKAMERLPRNCLYWLTEDKENPTAMVPYAEHINGTIRIDLVDDVDSRGNRPAIGVNLPDGASLLSKLPEVTLFDYKGFRYAVMHRTISVFAGSQR